MSPPSASPGGNPSSPSSGKKTDLAVETAAAAIKPDTADEVVNPPDFTGEVETDNGVPSLKTLRAIEDYVVLDNVGKTHPFKSLYSGHNVARRMLIIFVRHFFCGVRI
ncbi:hypothetical protein ONZ43_g5269 [Nemania bipapillata]|uniref:Uncharacterized protein n=1 Tax=Nemania bipapillata TaxID=110536 RepID=A0ACC2ICV5_9PEZI|nr:hypothetical protein ONZ43_g5269 [Nemania bipapillata]